MHMIRKVDAPFVKKDAEERRYYLPDRDPLEVIETLMQPNASQSPHSHEVIREAMLVLEGEVFVAEIISGKTLGQTLGAGDFVVFEPKTLHFMENKSESSARTFHFKFLGEGKNRTLFMNDKTDATSKYTLTETPDIETRYSSYVETHSTLDKIIWQVPAFLVAVSALGFGLLGALLPNNTAAIPPFSHQQTLGMFLCFWGAMYLIGCYVMDRLRHHHALVGKAIAALDSNGYFKEREKSVERRWPMSATSIVKSSFIALGVCFFAWGIAIFTL